MEVREIGVYSAKGEKRGLCCVKMKKDGGVFIVERDGSRFGPLGWVWVEK